MRISIAGWRFLAYSIFGIVLLIVYQIVFMARTSASRDWNHLHDSHFTLPDVQRFALSNVMPPNNSAYPTGFQKTCSSKSYRYVTNATAEDPIALSRFADVFAYPGKVPANGLISFRVADLIVADGRAFSIDELVAEAGRRHAPAIVLEMAPDWVPNFGLVRPKIPIVAIEGALDASPNTEVTLHVGSAPSDATFEYTIEGHTADSVLIADSRISENASLVFLELARVFEKLVSAGWRPFRTVKFVSFAHYSAEEWARKHKSLLWKNAIAYIDCGPVPAPSGRDVYTTPLLENVSKWALDQLRGGGVLPQNGSLELTHPSAPLGGDTFLFDFGVPSLSVDFESPETAAQFLGLLVSTLAQGPVLPWSVSSYAPLISRGCDRLASELAQAASTFDENVEAVKFLFTQEFPWYQFKAKFAAFRQRKVANLKMHFFEQHLLQRKHHALFGSNPDHSGTQLKQEDTCQLIEHLLHKIQFNVVSR